MTPAAGDKGHGGGADEPRGLGVPGEVPSGMDITILDGG